MAEYVPITPGTGANISADVLSADSSFAQQIKILDGTLGSNTPVKATSNNELQVRDTNFSLASAALSSVTTNAWTLQGGETIASFNVSGAFVGTYQFQGEVNAGSAVWVNLPVYDLSTNTTTSASTALTAATANYKVDVAGFAAVRINVLTRTSGTLTIIGTATAATSVSMTPLPASVAISGTATVSGSVSITGTPTVSVSGSVTTVAAGDVASGSTDSGNPVKVGGLSASSASAVTAGQRTNAMFDTMGRQVVTTFPRQALTSATIAITSSTTATSLIAAVASTFNDIYNIEITNSSSTATLVTLSDNGTAKHVWSIPGGSGITKNMSVPITQAAANTAWTITCGTSVASIYVNVTYAAAK